MAKYRIPADKGRLRSGMVLWAYAFQENSSKTGLAYNQPPVKGRLCSVGQIFDDRDADVAFDSVRRPQYFVPFKKNSDSSYVWSKRVDISSRHYADTEEEAIEGYNELIDGCIAWHRDRMAGIEAYKK